MTELHRGVKTYAVEIQTVFWGDLQRMSKQTSIHAQNSISHVFEKVQNYCGRNQEIKTCTRHICCSTCVTVSTALPLSNDIRDIQLFNGNMSFSRNQYWTNTWQLCVTSLTPSSYTYPRHSDLLGRIISSSTDHYDKKKGRGGRKNPSNTRGYKTFMCRL